MTLRKFSLILFLYGIAALTQTFFLLNHDVSWCIHAASRLLAGGTYMKDFFDINPPLALYLYTPPVILGAFFHIGIMYALPIYIFIVATISLYGSAILIKKIFEKSHPWLANIFLLTLVFLFLIFPSNDFGQREHLLVILVMPYLLATIYRLQYHSIPTLYGAGIGVLACMGFVLKPYFLATFILVELYYLYQFRRGWFHLRSETLAILIFLFSYVISLFIFHTNYIHVIVPQALKYYYLGFHDPWVPVVTHPVVLFSLALSVFFYCNRHASYKHESMIFLLSMWGFLFAYFMQKTVWIYHYLPVLCMAVLLGLLQLASFLLNSSKKKSYPIFNILLMLMVFAYPIYYYLNNFYFGIVYKKTHMPLISYMSSHAKHRSIYVLTSRIHNIFPALDYADVRFESRFPHFSMLPGMIVKERAYQHDLPPDLIKDQDQLIEMVTDDLLVKKPDFIFVDVQRYNSYLPDYISFNYVEYFSKNDEFKHIWKSYHQIGYTEVPSFFPIASQDAHLYVASSFKAIQLADVPGVSVVLVGQGLHRTVYYTENHEFLLWKDAIISVPFEITPAELSLLDRKSATVISKNELNGKMINQIIQRALRAGSPRMYAFQVYERDQA